MIDAGTGHVTAVQTASEATSVRAAVMRLKEYLTSQILGQDKLVERLLIDYYRPRRIALRRVASRWSAGNVWTC